MKDNSKFSFNRIIITIMNILFVILLFIKSLSFNTKLLDSSPEQIIFPWVVVSAVLHIINYLIRKSKFYDFGMWYITISYAFLFGLVFRKVFNLNYSLVWDPVKNYSPNDLLKAYSFSLLALNCFGVGYFFTMPNLDKDKPLNNKSNVDNITQNKDKQIFLVGIILTLVGGICMLINDYHIIRVLMSYNSYIGYQYAGSSGLFDDLAFLFLPGVFLLLSSKRLSKKQKMFLFLFSISYFLIVMMLTGSRKIKLFSIISLSLGYTYLTKNDKKRKISILKVIFYVIGGIMLINLLITIRDNRFNLTSIIPNFFQNLFEFKMFKDIFGEVFSETGLTGLSVASIIKTVPSVFPYQYGKTFLRTMPSFLPIGWLVGDFFYEASSTNVINTYLNLPLGSSFLGDLYWNWGFVGGLFTAIIFGIVFGKIFNNFKQDNNLDMAIYFSFFSQFLILVRAELFDVFRPIILILIISFLVKKTNFLLR